MNNSFDSLIYTVALFDERAILWRFLTKGLKLLTGKESFVKKFIRERGPLRFPIIHCIGYDIEN